MPNNNSKSRGRKAKGANKKRSNKRGGPRASRPRRNGGWSVPGGRIQRSRGPRYAAHSSGAMMDCCILTNPFDPRCEGCKYPDGENAHSIATSWRTLLSVTASSYGNAWVNYFGALPYSYIQATATSATTYNTPSTFSSVHPPTIFTSNAQRYRIVCWGVQVRVVSAVPDTAGEIIFTRLNTTPPLGASGVSSFGLKGNDAETVPCVTGATYTFISRRSGKAIWHYQNADTVLWQFADTQFPWDGLAIELIGGKPNATTLSVQLVYHVEFQSAPETGLYLIAPQDPPANPAITTVTSQVQQALPSVMTGSNEQLGDKIKHLVAERVRKAARNASGLAREAALEGLSALFAP